MKVTRGNSRVSSRTFYLLSETIPACPLLKRIGLPFCTYCYYCYLLLVTNCLAIKLPVTDNFSAWEITLLKTTCHFLLLLVGFDTLTYRKDYDWSPILVGHHVTLKPMEGIMQEIELRIRYYNLVSIGLPSSRIPVSLSCLVMNVKELVISVSVRKCLWAIHLLLNHLMFGALIIWDLLLPLMGIHIF